MGSFLCWSWPFLLGALVGWLAAGWLARQALARQPATVERVMQRIVEKPVERVVEKTIEVPVDRVVERIVERVVEKQIDNPTHLAQIAALTATAALVPALRHHGAELEAQLKLANRPAAVDLQAAAAHGFKLKHADDLEIVEGIGPKIAELLRGAGVITFHQLAATTPAQLQTVLDAAGPHFKLAHPETWPEQAALAAGNHWRALKALQDALDAGQRA